MDIVFYSLIGTDANNTFQFVEQIRKEDLSSVHMVSFDVRSLFTNVPLKKTIKICLDRLYRGDPNHRPSIPESTLKKLLELCVCNNTFVFNGRVYEQIDGVAMGSSLAPLLANVYAAHLEEEFILKSSPSFNPTMYRRYVDDSFCLFREWEHATKFMEFISSIDPAIQFEMEDEVDDRLSFLDTVIKRSSNNPYPEINTRIKPTDKGLFYNFSSFIPDSYKRNLVYRVYRIASSDNIFKDNLQTLKAKFLKNGFPSGFFNQIVNKFLEKQYTPEMVPKKTVTIALPYLGPLSTIIRRRLKKLISRFYPLADLNIVFRRGKTIKTMFSYKDNFPMKCSVSNTV